MQEHTRFLRKVKKTDECWEWTGAKTTKGYGHFTHKRGGRAHRYSYEYYVGKIPKNLTIDHLCKNKICVNPKHLEAVTMKENVLRSNGVTAMNARKTHCLHGHEFTEENTHYRKVGKSVQRLCRECCRQRNRIWVLKTKALKTTLSKNLTINNRI